MSTTISSSYSPGFKSGEFHHAVLCISGGIYKLYLDGNLVQTSTSTNLFTTMTSVTQTFIGANPALNNSFRGYIGDVRVYNKAITATQVSNLYMNRNLIAYYPFDNSVNSLTPNYATLQYDANFVGGVSLVSGYVGTSALQLTNTAGVKATQYLTATPTNFYLNSTTGLTISCWVNFDSTTNTNNIMRIFDIPLFPNVKGLGVDICGTNVIVSSWNTSGLIGVMDKLSVNTLNSLINPKSVSTNAGACAFALKLLYSNYTNPVICVKKYTEPETDFYADLTGKLGTGYLATGTSFKVWLGSDTSANVIKWYDQTGNNNTATAFSVGGKYPSLSGITANIVYNYNANTNTTAPSGYYIFFDQCYFTLPNGAFPYGTSHATYITKTYISPVKYPNQNPSTGPYHSNYPAGGTNTTIFSTNSQSTSNYNCGMINIQGGLALFSIGSSNSLNNANGTLTAPMLNTSIAFSYNDNTQRMYVNGSNVGTFTYNISNINIPNNNPAIGFNKGQANAPGCFYFFYAIPLDLSLNNTDRDLLEKTI